MVAGLLKEEKHIHGAPGIDMKSVIVRDMTKKTFRLSSL